MEIYMFAPVITKNEILLNRQWERAYEGERSGTICVQTRTIDLFIDRLSVIYAEAFSGAPWYEKWTIDEARAELKSLADRGSVFIVSLDPETGDPVGCGIGLPLSDRVSSASFRERGLLSEEDIAASFYVAELCTAANARNRGVCSDVLAGLLQAGREAGFERAITRTRTDNDGMIRIFARNGFKHLVQYSTATGGVASERIVFEGTL
jgi:RimJ/RimL family protein N-acetyltransferase